MRLIQAISGKPGILANKLSFNNVQHVQCLGTL